MISVLEEQRDYFPGTTRNLATALCIKNNNGCLLRRRETQGIKLRNKQERTRRFEYKERKHIISQTEVICP
jgi:hypothetical protein